MVHDAISGATSNIQKSNRLFVGGWKKRTGHPLGFQWSEQGGRYLGICLGNMNAWQQRNWTPLDIKIREILHKWGKVPQATSYLERKLILNQLVEAKLTHILAIFQSHHIPRHNGQTGGLVHMARQTLEIS
jgi:hypothetical protein